MQQQITKWYTSDWHRHHKNLVLSGFRKFSCVEEMDETILHNYNELVKPWDIVYNLGDLTLNLKYDALAKDISKFNGTKIIIAGNHDSMKTLERLKQDGIIGNWHLHKNVKDGEHVFALHHWPLLDYHSAMKPDIHLHGHSHNLLITPYNIIDVGVDAWGFKPVNKEDILLKVNYKKSNTATMTVYWGDGASSTRSSSGNVTFSHTYSAAGNYSIRVRITSGTGTYSISNTSFWGNMFNAYSDVSILTGVRLSNQVTAINQYAFSHCPMLSDVSIPSTVTTVGQGAFQYASSLTCAVFPSSVSAITDYVCQYCDTLAIASLPMSATSVGAGSFGYCNSMLRITLPPSITSIGAGLFQYCYALQKLIIPSTVTSIGSLAFQYCTSLRTLIVPSSVTSIAAQAFNYASSMLTYTVQRTTPPTLSNSNAFTGISGIAKIRVPSANLTTYRGATNWSTYANYREGY